MHKPNLIVFLLLGLAWVALIISYGSYWYVQQSVSQDNSDYYTKSYASAANIKVVVSAPNGKDTQTYSWKSIYGDEDAYKNTLSNFKASLSFAVIAWIILTVNLLLIILSLADILSKIPLPLGLAARFLSIVALIFCLISLFIFVGVSNARYNDCKNVASDQICDDNKDNHAFDFVHSDEIAGNDYKQSPYTGWAAIVVATGFTLFGTVSSLLLGKF